MILVSHTITKKHTKEIERVYEKKIVIKTNI